MTLESDLLDGKYRLEVELGAGAFGSVHRATQFVLERPLRQLALKLFKNGVITPENAAQQFNDALAVIDLLSGEPDWEIRQHFVTVFDLGLTQEDAPRGYVAMELVKGGSLSKRIRDYGKFTLAGTKHYLAQLLRAMAYMHRNRFVHSDLKPDNILVYSGRGEDLIKIGDFGLSGRFQGLMGEGPRGGTFHYLALESLHGSNTTPSCDVFALGLIAYEMLTGKHPYEGVGATLMGDDRNDLKKLNELHIRSREQPVKLLRGDFPELGGARPDPVLGGMLEIINRMLEPYPDKRYASVEEAWCDFQQLEGDSSSGHSKSKGDRPRSGSEDRSSLPEEARKLHRQCNAEISMGHFAEAAQLANRIIQEFPEELESYLVKSRMFLAQARRQTQDGVPQLVIASSRKQALTPLKKGLQKCPRPEEQKKLRQELANIYRMLGDEDAARVYMK
jgi:serine/threonine protein kinase